VQALGLRRKALPLYDYRCEVCEKVSEIRHGFDEKAGPCAHCGGPLVRLFHAAPIVFKGSGFYVTDSRPSSAASTAAAEKPAEKSGEKSAETKTSTPDAARSSAPAAAAPSPPKGGEAAA
jgi:putative FmdB family regulatory protein